MKNASREDEDVKYCMIMRDAVPSEKYDAERIRDAADHG